MKYRILLLLLLVSGSAASAEPIQSSEIRVVDGDTIEARGARYRMVGYDAPETATRGWHKVGSDEKALGLLAKERFQELINSGTLDLQEVPCACPRSKIEDRTCNHGRKCAILRLNGKNIGDSLIAEELAVPFVCGETRCPKMPNWPEIIKGYSQ
jgi:endonuclease YncB( thermonuclease family)